jgi:hypothetical protein
MKTDIKTCTYTLVDDETNTWECSKCRHWWSLNNGSPFDNNMRFCPFCGKIIWEIEKPTIEELIKLIE